LTVIPGESYSCLRSTGETVEVLHYTSSNPDDLEERFYIPVYRLPELVGVLPLEKADVAILEAMVLCFESVEVRYLEDHGTFEVRVVPYSQE
jgi:hypothetical protein